MKETLGIILAVLVFIVSIYGGIFIGVHEYREYQCKSYEQITGKETLYNSFDSCYVKNNGIFERYDAYKMRIVTRDQK